MALPYLQRRGDVYFFRIAVPPDLRATIGKREITQSLKTPDRRAALPKALHLAAQVTTLFAELRTTPEGHCVPLSVEIRPSGSKPSGDHGSLLDHSAVNSSVQAMADEARKKVATLRPPKATHAPAAPESPPAPGNKSPRLSEVILAFLANYPKSKEAMKRKHEIVLPIFLDIIGDKRVSEIKQTEIRGFFATINALPPYATREAERLGVTLRELAEQDHEEIISQKSFLDTYKACVRVFLKESQREYHDAGFPQGLHANYDYDGDSQPRKKQRAFTPDELKRIFEGPELRSFAKSPQLVHQFWLPAIGLFTGARVNEICQINPAADFGIDQASGIPFLLISEDTAAGEGIEKSVKTKEPRKVPLHPHLIDLGLPECINTPKTSEAKQLPGLVCQGRQSGTQCHYLALQLPEGDRALWSSEREGANPPGHARIPAYLADLRRTSDTAGGPGMHQRPRHRAQGRPGSFSQGRLHRQHHDS